MAHFVCSPTRTVRCIHQLGIALIAICGFAAGASAQTTVTLSTPRSHINADLTIQGGASGMVDFSTSDVLASKVSSESYTRRMMLKFDTQNFIPANAVIQSARLYLVLQSGDSSENRPLTAYHVSNSFVKGQTNWDFNTSPGTSDYSLMATPYQDGWLAASSAGTATSYNGTGATHGASRFDYVFFSNVAALLLTSVNVPDTRINGMYPSDHDAVVAVFIVQ
jgi:hypothetical protein